jgi:predicted DCC family thiol-disulfide oxidoreductase YuxK
METIPLNYPLTLLYDGACPVCNLEMDNLKHRNTEGLLVFIDISLPEFDPLPYGATLAEMNGLIHAMRPDGSLVVGVEVFRLAYGAVGLGHLTGPTAWPGLKPLVDTAYAVFARNRYGFSRAFMPLLTALGNARAARRRAGVEAAAQNALASAAACQSGQCELPTGHKVFKGETS